MAQLCLFTWKNQSLSLDNRGYSVVYQIPTPLKSTPVRAWTAGGSWLTSLDTSPVTPEALSPTITIWSVLASGAATSAATYNKTNSQLMSDGESLLISSFLEIIQLEIWLLSDFHNQFTINQLVFLCSLWEYCLICRMAGFFQCLWICLGVNWLLNQNSALS